MFNLICMTFTGDYVTEHRGFETVEQAWNRSSDMGSRWYFYPFHFVTSASGKTIIDAPEMMQQFIGKRVVTVQREFARIAALPEMMNSDCDQFTWKLAA